MIVLSSTQLTSSEAARIMKYVLVTGGVVSGLGKGVTASSIGVLLKNSGLRVTSIKIGEQQLLCAEPKGHSGPSSRSCVVHQTLT